MDGKLILFALIILIFLCVTDNLNTTTLIIMIGAILLYALFYKKEKLINEQLVSEPEQLSKYDNLELGEVDMTKQEVELDGENDSMDNADVIEQVITRGTTLLPAFSPTNNHYNWELQKKYNIPLSGKQNMDEMLARKQSQRAALNRDALTGKSRHTANTYQESFREELNENEERVWYSSEAQPLETDWTSY
jgi:hypothetical protein